MHNKLAIARRSLEVVCLAERIFIIPSRYNLERPYNCTQLCTELQQRIVPFDPARLTKALQLFVGELLHDKVAFCKSIEKRYHVFYSYVQLHYEYFALSDVLANDANDRFNE